MSDHGFARQPPSAMGTQVLRILETRFSPLIDGPWGEPLRFSVTSKELRDWDAPKEHAPAGIMVGWQQSRVVAYARGGNATLDELVEALRACVVAMEAWGKEEDGVPTDGVIGRAYDAAKRLLRGMVQAN